MGERTLFYGKVITAQIFSFATASILINSVFWSASPMINPQFQEKIVAIPNNFAVSVKSYLNQNQSKNNNNIIRQLNPQISVSLIEPTYTEETYPTEDILPSVEPTLLPIISATNQRPSILPTQVPDISTPTLRPTYAIPSPTEYLKFASPTFIQPSLRPSVTPFARPTQISQSTVALEQEVINLINAKRRAEGYQSLTLNNKLSIASRNVSRPNAVKNDMNQCVHSEDFQKTAEAAGYTGRLYGEVIGCGPHTPESLVDMWWKSPYHHDIIIQGSKIGVGWAEGNIEAQAALIAY